MFRNGIVNSLQKRKNNMIHSHSSNSIITKAVATINKAIKAKAYRSILSGFKVKSKVQFISNVVSAKISLPSWWGGLPKSKKGKLDSAQSFWNLKFSAHTHSYFDSQITYVRPQAVKGYGALLNAASKLGEFSWADLLLSIPHHAQRVKEAYAAWGKYSGYKKSVYRKGKTKSVYVSFDSYANNYFNSYRSYFVRNGIIAKVKGKRGIYVLTANGEQLLKGVNQIMR